jgi:hypothetical protein
VAKRVVLSAALAVAVVVGGGAAAMASVTPDLSATGPTSVSGTTGTAVFELGDQTYRQVRYHDDGTLVYSFTLSNEGMLPVRIQGFEPPDPDPRLFDYLKVTDSGGDTDFDIGRGETAEVQLHLGMTQCETLSARAGSSVTEVTLVTSNALGIGSREVTVTLPEEVRAGSPREAGCADATANSRSPG